LSALSDERTGTTGRTSSIRRALTFIFHDRAYALGLSKVLQFLSREKFRVPEIHSGTLAGMKSIGLLLVSRT